MASTVTLVKPIENQRVSVTIFPDTLVVDGDKVKFDGLIYGNLTKITYQISTQNEKKKWEKRVEWNKEILVIGDFQTIQPKTNQYAFDYSRYLVNNRYQGQFKIVKILKSREKSKGVSNFAHYIRASSIARVERYCSSKIATLLSGLLFNYRQNDYYENLSIFTENGLLHLFSISGMHVYFFLGCIDFIFRRLHASFLIQFVPFVLISAILAMLFGISPSILRAIFAYLFSWYVRESSFKMSQMDRYSLVLFLCLCIEPRALLQLSGQLSFSFSFYLLFVSMDSKSFIKGLLTAQIIPLLSAPILFYLFYDWPVLGGTFTFLLMPIFDVLLLPLSSLMFLFCSFKWLNFFLDHIITSVFSLSGWFLSIFPHLKLVVGQPPLWLVVLSIVFALVFYEKRKYSWFLVSLLVLPIVPHMISPYEKVTFIDIGQGDCIVLQSKGNREVFVIDTGGKLSFKVEKWQERSVDAGVNHSLIPYLKGEGIKKIDGLFLTHGDTDHLGDAKELISKIPVKEVYLGKGSLANKNVKKLRQSVTSKIPFKELNVGLIMGGKGQIKILSPENGKGENNDSLVILAQYANTRFLLTGDLEKSGEEKLLKNFPNLKVDVLKVGHHGSKTSTSERFIKQIHVKEAVISSGRKNRYKHPHKETLETLERQNISILRTDKQGMIQYKMWHRLKKLTFLND